MTLSLPSSVGIGVFAIAPWAGPILRDEPWGWAAFAGAFAVLGLLGVLSTLGPAAIAGYAFGPVAALPGLMVGYLLCAGANYVVARRFSRERVGAVLEDYPRLRGVRDVLVGAPGPVPTPDHRCPVPGFWRTAGLVALVRLIPNSPFAFNNVLLSSLGVPMGRFVLGTALGIFPRVCAMVLIGSSIQTLSRQSIDDAIPAWLKITGVIVTIVLLVVVGMIAKHAWAHASGKVSSAPASEQRAA